MLDAFLPGDRRRALAGEGDLPDHVRGAALFADLAGFTPLTEALARELGPRRGAEELTLHLDRLFTALVDALHGYGGEVLYFSGDAITCWLDGDDGRRAIACALAMQEALAALDDVATPGGTRVALGVKIGAAVGHARRFVVGDPEVQMIDVLAGAIVDRLADAEHLASRGEVLVEASALRHLGESLVAREHRAGPDGSTYAVVTDLRDRPERVASTPPPALPAGLVRSWVLPALYDRMREAEAFAAEFRPACPLFLRFAGFDFGSDDAAPAKLDAFVRAVQRTTAALGGSLVQLTLGDKGAYLYVVFGAPLTHEDDAARACRAALELVRLPAVTAVREVQIGLAHGHLYAGTYGHPQRRAFACIGDAVNVAARLMAAAAPGTIQGTAEVRAHAGGAFTWTPLPAVALKGKREPIAVLQLDAATTAVRTTVASDEPLIGREAELGALVAAADDTMAGRGRVVGLAADAGMGKSRLLAALRCALATRGIALLTGACQPYGHRIGYFAWQGVWSQLLGLEVGDTLDARCAALERTIAAIDPALLPRMPLFAPLVDLALPDTPLTASFDAKLRKTSLEDLAATCLRALARRGPIAIALEDCHWIDELSRDLLQALARSVGDLPVLIVAAYRPAGEPGGGLGVAGLPHFDEIVLEDLPSAEARALAVLRLRAVLHGGEPAAAVVDLVCARAQGNPFYIGELATYLAARRVDVAGGTDVQDVELPDSLHSLVLSRIDGIAEAPRRTLKVASVVGRDFDADVLPGVVDDLGSADEVRRHLAALVAAGLIVLASAAPPSYAFRHALTQEVAYESLPYALRATLHERVGAYLERADPAGIERNLDLLAHHYGRTGNVPKKREYWERAGVAAQAKYANAAAIVYFERLVPLLDGAQRIDALLRLVRVLELVDWTRARDVAESALAQAEAIADPVRAARCATALAEVARKQNRYDDAERLLERARGAFDEAGDRAGVGEVEHLAGTLAAQRGRYDEAVQHYETSLALREELADRSAMAGLYSNLGVVAEYRGDLATSQLRHERALALRREIGDRRGIGVSMICIGMTAFLQKQHARARDCFAQALLASRDVGDGWMTALANHNLANAARALGDLATAREHYAESLRAFDAFQDRWACAFLFEDIAALAARECDAPTALTLVGAADALREASDTPRAPSLAADLEAELAPAVESLDEVARQRLREEGKALDFAQAVARALEACTSGSGAPAPSSKAAVAG